MTDLIISQPLVVSQVDGIISAWLNAKSSSIHTVKNYTSTITAVRAYLLNIGLDLNHQTDTVALGIQSWLNSLSLSDNSKHQKLAIVSSFYKYSIERSSITGIYSSPIKSDMRIKIQPYAKVAYISDVAEKLAKIDRSYLDGIRDYALLYLTLMTGKRLSEIASLTVGDINISNDKVTIVFQRTKGNKTAKCIFTVDEMTPLLDFLKEHTFSDTKSNDPLWVSYSRNNSKGNAISVRSLENICYKWMNTNFHTLRHTFAKEMEASGAKVSDIQSLLGHTSLATTGLYLASLSKGENDKASVLKSKFIKD